MFLVEQSDRIFAAKKCTSSRRHIWEAKILRGDCDSSYWVQTFAEHREYLENEKSI